MVRPIVTCYQDFVANDRLQLTIPITTGSHAFLRTLGLNASYGPHSRLSDIPRCGVLGYNTND